MVLGGFTFMDVVFGVLYSTLGILVVVLGYRYILRRLSKGSIEKKDYCELYTLEMDPAHGELPFYFTSEIQRQVRLLLLDEKMELLKEIAAFECKVGGNIVRFDSSTLNDGVYYYSLETENQKVMKKMYVYNA